ncbi:hypothetical protein F4212_14895 [Candidatus Poribacteria bacterium]|nr:hypothetical protein [Candidatus Poribacteria bacterium]
MAVEDAGMKWNALVSWFGPSSFWREDLEGSGESNETLLYIWLFAVIAFIIIGILWEFVCWIKNRIRIAKSRKIGRRKSIESQLRKNYPDLSDKEISNFVGLVDKYQD